MTDIAYIALGSNVGDREATLEQARSRLAALPRSRILAASTVEDTAPLGDVPQGNYLNQMVALETSLTPEDLLAALLEIERELGRKRRERWGPRTIDLDIVMYGARRIESPSLTVPHPQLPNRDFWQRELIELRGEWQ